MTFLKIVIFVLKEGTKRIRRQWLMEDKSDW